MTLPDELEQMTSDRDRWKAEAERLRDELLRLETDARRQLLSLMKTLGVTKDDMLSFFIRQEEKQIKLPDLQPEERL